MRKLTKNEIQNPSIIPSDGKLFESRALTSQGGSSNPDADFYEFNNKKFHPGTNQHWKTTKEGLANLKKVERLMEAKNSLRYIRYLEDFPYTAFTNIWTDTITGSFTESKIYVVQTNPKVIQRCNKIASVRDEVEKLFGFRNMDGFIRPQSWCRECRTLQSKAA